MSDNNNTYFIDPESVSEMARLIEQDRLFTKLVNGVLPELSTETIGDLREILDISCGPGGWAIDVATAYQDQLVRVVGLDISKRMIEYAQAQAEMLALDHLLSFVVGDATAPLDFPDASFDLINIRFLVGFLTRDKHDLFFRECFRLLKPGGTLRITESELGITSSNALNSMAQLLAQSLKLAGHGSPQEGPEIGMIAMLPDLLQHFGYQQSEYRKVVTDYDWGTAYHAKFYEDWKIAYLLSKSFFVAAHLITSEEFDQLYQQMLLEIMEEGFQGNYDLQTFIATKPLSL